MLDIGLEVKILRERLQMSAKDLAERIGLSQSQMSRLESGQRRIDTGILAKIAAALGVEPSHFFPGSSAPSGGVIPPSMPSTAGKEIRAQRRRRHISAEDLALKLGLQKHQVLSIEEGKRELSPELAERISKVLRLPPHHFLQFQYETIRALEAKIARLNQALAEAERGAALGMDGRGEGPSVHRRGIPVLGTVARGYPAVFDSLGRPAGEPDDFVYLPAVDEPSAFAVHALGDSMEARSEPSFAEGELLVFLDAPLRSRDFALVRKTLPAGAPPEGGVVFRQVFFEPGSRVRLQPLNLSYAAEVLGREEILGMWRLAARVARF